MEVRSVRWRTKRTYGPCDELLLLVRGASVASTRLQQVEGSGSETGDSAVFPSAGYIELITPLTSKVGVNTCGFYLDEIRRQHRTCSSAHKRLCNDTDGALRACFSSSWSRLLRSATGAHCGGRSQFEIIISHRKGLEG